MLVNMYSAFANGINFTYHTYTLERSLRGEVAPTNFVENEI